MALAVTAACGGKAKHDGPDAWEAGTGGVVAATGGSAGTPPTAQGGATPSGGVNAGGSIASGGRVAAGGATSGGAETTGGTAQRPEPGTEIWFPRGYLSLEYMYSTMIADLFGVTFSGNGDSRVGVEQRATDQLVRSIDPYVRDLVAQISDSQLLDGLACQEADARCAEATANTWASRLWRRPLESSESASLIQLFADAAAGTEIAALREIVQRILSTKDAYLMPALGVEVSPGKYELSELEQAGILAIGLTGLPPDEELLRRAVSGGFELEAEIDRLLETDQARVRMDRMIRKWFYIPDAHRLWMWSSEPELAQSMLQETRLFIGESVFGERAPISHLLTADYSYANGLLAEIYGLSSPTGSSFERVELAETRRRGLMGQASYLSAMADSSGPSYAWRGTVPMLVLCEELPAAPPDIGPLSPPPAGEYSEREYLDAVTSTPACRSCHQVMNPVAFAFDHFDQRAAHRELDRRGYPIDSSGSFTSPGGSAFAFADSTELAQQMARTASYSKCFLENAVSFLVGRDTTGEALNDYVARATLPSEEERVLDALRRFVLSDHFRYRKD